MRGRDRGGVKDGVGAEVSGRGRVGGTDKDEARVETTGHTEVVTVDNRVAEDLEGGTVVDHEGAVVVGTEIQTGVEVGTEVESVDQWETTTEGGEVYKVPT